MESPEDWHKLTFLSSLHSLPQNSVYDSQVSAAKNKLCIRALARLPFQNAVRVLEQEGWLQGRRKANQQVPTTNPTFPPALGTLKYSSSSCLVFVKPSDPQPGRHTAPRGCTSWKGVPQAHLFLIFLLLSFPARPHGHAFSFLWISIIGQASRIRGRSLIKAYWPRRSSLSSRLNTSEDARQPNWNRNWSYF